jgi:predicted deacylase
VRRLGARALAAVLLLGAGCAPARLLTRYFLTACPADGPEPEHEMALSLEPVPLEAYAAALRAAAPAGVRERIVARVDGLPIYYFGPMGTRGGPRLLIIAGVHGNEIAGTLAAPRILADLRAREPAYAGVEVHLLTPANPVGLAHLARYNGAGCDVNRDFDRFQTREARTVRDVFTMVHPSLVLALHEGPQAGFYVVATRSAPSGLAAAMARAVGDAGLPLATRSFVRVPLGEAGADQEGWATTLLKRAVRLGSLGVYGERQGVAVLTTETDWAAHDLDGRVRAHVVAARIAARRLAAIAAAS